MLQEKSTDKRFNSLREGKLTYAPETVLEICVYKRKLAKYLCQMKEGLKKAGIITSPVWRTRSSKKGKITDCWYTLPIFLPKGLKVYKSKFSKDTFNHYHNG